MPVPTLTPQQAKARLSNQGPTTPPTQKHYTTGNPRRVELSGRQYEVDLPNKNYSIPITPQYGVFDNLPNDEANSIIDQNWVQKAFLIGDIQLTDPVDKENRYYTLATLKFTNSTLGGNIGINARPQFTRYSDIRVPGRYPGRSDRVTLGSKTNMGMGRYYSEALDNHAQIIYLRFGVPAFNSLSNFIFGFYNAEDAMLARTGRISITFRVVKALTSLSFFVSFPLLSTVIWGIKMVDNFFDLGSNKFYYLKPTMHTYWSAVNTLVNVIATNLDLLPPALTPNLTNTSATGQKQTYNPTYQRINTPYAVPQSYLQALHDWQPDIFNKEYGIDMFAVANRAQRMANMQFHYEYGIYNKLNNTQRYLGYLKAAHNGNFVTAPSLVGQHNTFNKFVSSFSAGTYITGTTPTVERSIVNSQIQQMMNQPTAGANIELNSNQLRPKDTDFYSYLKRAFNTSFYYQTKVTARTQATNAQGQPNKNSGLNITESAINIDPKTGNQIQTNQARKDINKIGNFLDAEWSDGSAFATFRVDFTGQGSLSLSNSAGETELANRLNSRASNARQTRFNVANGNIGLGAIAGAVFDFGKDVVAGVSSALHIDGILNALLGTVNVEIPKYWEDSSVSLPTSNYTMTLISPYGNMMSMLQNIYIPLAMIMAGAMPLATGKASYTAPFICQLFDRGHNQIRLGIIDSLTISTGTSNLPYTMWGRPLAIEVSFSVANLSSIMAMPLAAGTLFGSGGSFFDIMGQDSPLNDYIAVLTGRDIFSQIYPLARAQMKLGEAIKHYYSFTSPARWAGFLHQTLTTGALSWTLIPSMIGGLNEGLALPEQQSAINQHGPAKANNPG